MRNQTWNPVLFKSIKEIRNLKGKEQSHKSLYVPYVRQKLQVET